MALFSVSAKETKKPDEVLFSANKYEEKSKDSIEAADKLELDAVEFKNIPVIEHFQEPSISRLKWIQAIILPRLNTPYMKLEERKRISTCWMCGILFQKHVVPRILEELEIIKKSEEEKKILKHHETKERHRWVLEKNKKWNIAYRDGDWTCSCKSVNFAGNPVCWNRACLQRRRGVSEDKTIWQWDIRKAKELQEKNWSIFDTAFPGEREHIKEYTSNTGFSGWLLTNWFVAFVKYKIFLIVPTLQPFDEKRRRREIDLENAWKEIDKTELSNLSDVFRLVVRQFTTIEALFHAITTWYKSPENNLRIEMKFTTNDYGKSARINLLDFCAKMNGHVGFVTGKRSEIFTSIKTIFDKLATCGRTHTLEKESFGNALGKIINQGALYIKYLHGKNEKKLKKGEIILDFIKDKDLEFHFSRDFAPRSEIFMNDAEYDDASCWLWKQFAQQEEVAKTAPELRTGVLSPAMVPTHVRNIPLYQNWTMTFSDYDDGAIFYWEGQENRIYAWTNNFWRKIGIDFTYLLNEKSESLILQTVAHEFGHAMTMLGRHAVPALFRPWARYFGETDPRQYDRRDSWLITYKPIVLKLQIKTLRI